LNTGPTNYFNLNPILKCHFCLASPN